MLDSLSISIVLIYLYKGCLFGRTPVIDCLEDIRVLVKVEQYSMACVLSTCEAQPIAQLKEVNDDEWVVVSS